jgi:glutathione synthase/RimK-type ligase-like ATP-grasp enzyme
MRLLLIAFKNSHGAIRLQEEVSKAGVDLVLYDPHELPGVFLEIDPADFDVLYIRQFYTEDRAVTEILDLAKRFKAGGKRVIDSVLAEDDYAKSNKFQNLEILSNANFPVPQSVRLSDIDQLQYPLVIKWQYGFGGKHIYYIEEKNQLDIVTKEFPENELFAQEFIPAKYEYKVYCIGYKSLPFILQYKINPITRVSDLDVVKIIPKDELPYLVGIAERASRILGREISKVDVLETERGLVVLEVNRCPGGKVYEEATGQEYFKALLDYLSH